MQIDVPGRVCLRHITTTYPARIRRIFYTDSGQSDAVPGGRSSVEAQAFLVLPQFVNCVFVFHIFVTMPDLASTILSNTLVSYLTGTTLGDQIRERIREFTKVWFSDIRGRTGLNAFLFVDFTSGAGIEKNRTRAASTLP